MAVGKAVGWMDEKKLGNERASGGVYLMDFYEAGSPWAISRTKATF